MHGVDGVSNYTLVTRVEISIRVGSTQGRQLEDVKGPAKSPLMGCSCVRSSVPKKACNVLYGNCSMRENTGLKKDLRASDIIIPLQ